MQIEGDLHGVDIPREHLLEVLEERLGGPQVVRDALDHHRERLLRRCIGIESVCIGLLLHEVVQALH
jgi:hypothetical protein